MATCNHHVLYNRDCSACRVATKVADEMRKQQRVTDRRVDTARKDLKRTVRQEATRAAGGGGPTLTQKLAVVVIFFVALWAGWSLLSPLQHTLAAVALILCVAFVTVRRARRSLRAAPPAAPEPPPPAQAQMFAPPAPPGWYQDPGSALSLRWWDGVAWTDRTTTL